MKKLILAAVMAVSATSAFANFCEAEMVNIRTNRVYRNFPSYDRIDACKEALKDCSREMRRLGLNGTHDCKLASVGNPYPNPNPNPYPVPNPNPYPYPNPNPNPYPGSVDSRRMLNQNESAIFSNRYVTVAGVSFNGTYAVRSTDGWNTITNGIRRESLAVTNGCSMNLCTSDSVIDVMSARYVKVVGIHFDERLVTQSTDGWNTLLSNVERRNLAETKGCISSRYAQICVGNQVINSMNRYSTVAGIQIDGRVVLKSSDGWNTLTPNVDPSNLVITR